MITAKSYVQMLEEEFFGQYEDWSVSGNYIFMHDNAPLHHKWSTSEYLKSKNIEVLEWPPLSPDLNPIKNLWGMLSQKVYQGGKSYQTSTELWEALVHTWMEIPLAFFQNLYNSMSNRMINVLENKGGKTKY